MLTTDPLYWKPYKPDIRLYTTDPSSDTLQYRYSPFTGTGTVTTGPSNSIPNHLSISLSQNTHGSFIAQFVEDSKAMEDADITVGSRIRVFCGKSSTTSFLCFGGIVREVGYDLGPDDKILYTMIGSSYGIRLNERVIYTNTQAAKLYTGELDLSDTSRKADSLLETTLAPGLNQDGLISISGLASSSDVETFIPQSIVEYGEMQDFVNLIEEGSGGTVVITPMTTGSALMQFKHENAIGGYGYAIKNKPTKETGINDDADDTMYMLAKARGFVKQFNKSNNFANRLYAIWAASEGLKTDYTLTGGFSNSNANSEDAWNFE